MAVAAPAPPTSLTLPRTIIRDRERFDAAVPVLRHGAGVKHKAVVVMGATGTGKSRLAVDLALRFGGEVINSDKMQIYKGLDVVTNKVTEEECAGVPHHLIGVARPDDEFTAADFRREAARAAAGAAERGRLPIIAGGSNSYVEELVDGDGRAFRERYDCFFLWVDVDLHVLRGFVARRVDEMCRRGLLEEHRKIERLDRMWRARRVDATEVFQKRGHAADMAWQRLVAAPCIDAVRSFLFEDQECSSIAAGKPPLFASGKATSGNISVFASAAAAMAAAAAI
uniref:Adenylate isopentenyltransferase n=1 Tax=Oryza punctata TaxID=4537 RepID=A0A0E0KKK2_ORYPU